MTSAVDTATETMSSWENRTNGRTRDRVRRPACGELHALDAADGEAGRVDAALIARREDDVARLHRTLVERSARDELELAGCARRSRARGRSPRTRRSGRRRPTAHRSAAAPSPSSRRPTTTRPTSPPATGRPGSATIPAFLPLLIVADRSRPDSEAPITRAWTPRHPPASLRAGAAPGSGRSRGRRPDMSLLLPPQPDVLARGASRFSSRRLPRSPMLRTTDSNGRTNAAHAALQDVEHLLRARRRRRRGSRSGSRASAP